MCRIALAVAALALFAADAAAKGGRGGGSSSGSGKPKSVYVHGYTRKDGTYVRPHYRSRPGAGAAGLDYRVLPPDGPPVSAREPEPPAGVRTTGRTAPPAGPRLPGAAPAASGVTPVLSVTAAGGEILVRTPRYRKANFVSPARTYLSDQEYLKVEVTFFRSKTAGVRRYPLVGRERPTLTDEHGRSYLLVLTDDDGGRVVQTAGEVTIPAFGSVTDTLVFTCPEPDATVLTLELPAAGVFDGPLRFTIPIDAIDR